MKNEKLTSEMLKRGDIHKGVKICMHEWRTMVNTFSEEWFGRKERWFNVMGLPFHLWSEENCLKLGDCVGEPVELDYARVKWRPGRYVW